MSDRNAFKRAADMFAKIKAAQALPDHQQRADALLAVGTYKSRGKGRGTPSRVYGNPRGRYVPHQGLREMERRQRRMKHVHES